MGNIRFEFIGLVIACMFCMGYGQNWSVWTRARHDPNEMSRHVTCTRHGEVYTGSQCVNVGEVYTEITNGHCKRNPLQSLSRKNSSSQGGRCYDAYKESNVTFLFNPKCTKRQRTKMYDNSTCDGVWKSTMTKTCSKSCGSDNCTFAMHCYNKENKTSYNCKDSDGKLVINVTRPCNKPSCATWGSWIKTGPCSNSCGRGHRTETSECVYAGELRLNCEKNQTKSIRWRTMVCNTDCKHTNNNSSKNQTETTEAQVGYTNNTTNAAAGGTGAFLLLLIIVCAVAFAYKRRSTTVSGPPPAPDTKPSTFKEIKITPRESRKENLYCEIDFKSEKTEEKDIDGDKWKISSSFEKIPDPYSTPCNIPVTEKKLFCDNGYYSTPRKHKLNGRVWNKSWYDTPRKRTLTGDVFLDAPENVQYSIPRREKIKSNSDFYAATATINHEETLDDVTKQKFGRVLSASSGPEDE